MPVPRGAPPTPAPTPALPPLTDPKLPIADLDGLLEEVPALLDNIVYYWDQLLFMIDVRPALQNGWGELRQRIAESWSSFKADLGQTSSKLNDAGLSGEQLKLKLSVINDLWDRFKNRGTPGRLRDLIEWIEALFDSIAKVVPQIEALKEFVVLVKGLINQTERLMA